jgi:hypothetical protein
VPSYQAYLYVTGALSLAFAVTLLVSGLGLLRMAPWARNLSIGYAIASLVEKLALAVYAFALLLPAYDEAFRPMVAKDPLAGQIAVTSAKAGVAGGPFLMMIYPAVVLVVMLLPSVADAFRHPKPRGRADESGYTGEEV